MAWYGFKLQPDIKPRGAQGDGGLLLRAQVCTKSGSMVCTVRGPFGSTPVRVNSGFSWDYSSHLAAPTASLRRKVDVHFRRLVNFLYALGRKLDITGGRVEDEWSTISGTGGQSHRNTQHVHASSDMCANIVAPYSEYSAQIHAMNRVAYDLKAAEQKNALALSRSARFRAAKPICLWSAQRRPRT